MSASSPFRTTLTIITFISLFLAPLKEGKGKTSKESKIDSLQNLVDNNPEDTVKIKALRRLTKYTMREDPDSALTLAQQASRLAIQSDLQYWISRTNNLFGDVFRSAGELDSSKHYYQLALKQTKQLDDQRQLGNIYSNLGVIHELQTDFEKAEQYHSKSLEIWKKSGRSSVLGRGYINLGVLFHRQGKFDQALENYEQATKHFKKAGKKRGLSQTYNNIGGIYWNQGEYPKALDHFLKGLKIKKERGDKRGVATAYSNIGNLYFEIQDYPKAREYFDKSIKMNKKVNNQWGLINCYSGLALLQEETGDWVGSLENYKKSIQLSHKMGNRRGESRNRVKMAGLMIFLASRPPDSLVSIINELRLPTENPSKAQNLLLDSSRAFLAQASSLLDSIEDPGTKAIYLLEKGNLLQQLNQPEKAESFFQSAYDIANEKGMKKEASEAVKNLSKIQYLLNKHKAAYENQSRYLELKQELVNENKSKDIGRMETQYKFEKKLLKQQKEKEKQKALAQAKHQRQNLIIAAISSGLGLVVLFTIFLFNRFHIIRKQKGIIEEQKQEVDAAFEQLHEKNKEITDSIQYASKIQEAILTSQQDRNKALKNHFIFFLPKDVVSGDFYWVHHDEQKDLTFWLTADCTGHGVPGAFMSMIGNRLFNEVVVEQGETDPGKILDRVREGIIDALGQSGAEDRKDGMDAALCILDREKMELRFAGGNNPLYVVGGANSEWRIANRGEQGDAREMGKGKRDKRIANSEKEAKPPITNYRNLKKAPEPEESPNFLEIKPDKQPIGQPDGPMKPFTTQTIPVQPGDTLYTFSDGFADQFGGPKGKKYRYKPFKRLLLSLQDKPMQEQKELLEKEFEDWRGNQEQVDDVVVVGLRL